MPWSELTLWQKAIRETDFSDMPYLFVICYLSSRIQKTYSTSTQQTSFLLLVALMPDRRSDGFTTDFASFYTRVDCTQKHIFGLMDGIEPLLEPLAKDGSRCIFVKNAKNI